jgi:hypothetical protein
MGRMRWLTAVVVLNVVCVATACTAPSASPEPSASPTPKATVSNPPSGGASSLLVDCADSFAASPGGGVIVLDGVELESGRDVQVSKSGEKVPAASLFAKTGLVVRAGVAVDLTIVGKAGTTMGWGSPAGRSTRVQVPACPALGTTDWLAWPGGLWLATPRCVHVAVAIGTRRADVRMSVGRACSESH